MTEPNLSSDFGPYNGTNLDDTGTTAAAALLQQQQQQQHQLPTANTTTTTATTTTTTGTHVVAFDIYDNISYEDALDDVHTRFILNLPESELRTADRIFVQIEQAWWYYEDFICDPRPHLMYLPRYHHLRPFAKELFEYSTVLPNATQFNEMWKQYSIYKKKISNYGCILLSSDYQRIVLCQVYNGKSYTLPSGKINEGEDGAAAAARETYEETGFDPSCRYGITATWKEMEPHRITWDVQYQYPKNKLVHQEDDNSNNNSNNNNNNGGGGGKRRTCYVIVGVPEDFPFAPVCRKEVSNIVWFQLDQLSSIPSFAVMPFVKPLRKWIYKQHNKSTSSTGSSRNAGAGVDGTAITSQELGRDSSNPKTRNATNNKKNRDKNKASTPQRDSRTNSRHRDRDGPKIVNDDDHDTNNIILSGLAKSGDQLRWTEEDMFQVNAKLLGRNVISEYDGNPHLFTEEGLSRIDPHAYRIVGGTLLNQHPNNQAGFTTPDPSQLQSLVHNESSNGINDFLTPFFSLDGATPWGEVIPDVQQQQQSQYPPPPPPPPSTSLTTATTTTTTMAQSKKSKQPRNKKSNQDGDRKPSVVDGSKTTKEMSSTDNIVPTDAQITAKSQAAKTISILKKPPKVQPPVASSKELLLYRQRRKAQYESNLLFIQNWVANLPKPQPNKYFGLFTLDVDAIMAQATKDVNHHQLQRM